MSADRKSRGAMSAESRQAAQQRDRGYIRRLNSDPARLERTRERRRERKRRARLRRGCKPRVLLTAESRFNRDQSRAAVRNAGEAWRWWLSWCPSEWLAAYYESLGKPWNNPRLSVGEAYRLRYQRDPAFYEREYARLQHKRARQRSQYRKGVGVIPPAALAEFRRRHSQCYHCGCDLTLRQRTIDHYPVPLIAGGLHAFGNIVIACLSCNSRRSDRLPDGSLGRHQRLASGRTP